MNTHNKTPQKKLLMISFTSLLCNSAYSHAANQENIDEIKRQQLRAPINTEQVSSINSYTGRIGASTVDAITGGTGTNLAIIETNLQLAAGQLSTTLGNIEGSGFATTTDSLHAISTAIGGLDVQTITDAATSISASATEIETSATNISASATEIATVTANLLTTVEFSDTVVLLGSSQASPNNDPSFIYADFHSLGQTSGDVSNLNVRLTAIDNAITAIPTTSLTPIEGPSYLTAKNSLAALAGTGALPNGSGSTNTFNPATQSLADITGAGFATATDSLVAIKNAITNIPTTSLANLGSSGTGANADPSFIYADFHSLGAGVTDVSSISSQFSTVNNAINALPTNTELGSALAAQTLVLQGTNDTQTLTTLATAISSIPTTSLAPIEGPAYLTAKNSLAALAGTGALPNGSGSVNTFNPATQSLADIAGAGFATADNSLVAISTAIASIPATDISTLATINQVNLLGKIGDTSGIYTQFTNVQKSLAFIVAQLIGDPIVAVDQAATNASLKTTVTVSNADSTVAYQNAINAALISATTAIATATQSAANTQAAINLVATAITQFNALATTLAGDGGYVTSGYSAPEINAALAQLNTGLAYLLLNQVA